MSVHLPTAPLVFYSGIGGLCLIVESKGKVGTTEIQVTPAASLLEASREEETCDLGA